jgi:hypothetical protein
MAALLHFGVEYCKLLFPVILREPLSEIAESAVRMDLSDYGRLRALRAE